MALSTGTDGPVIELRQYRLYPGTRERLIALFDREFVETQEAVGMQVLGQFRDLDDPDSFVWLRQFADMPARAQALAAFYGGPVWAAHRDAANATMVNSDNVLLLRPAAPDTGFAPATRPRCASDANAVGAGLVTCTICSLAPRTEDAFAQMFDASVLPLLQQAGARILARLVTHQGPNTFPRLPVREGETVFAWLSGFDSEQAHAQHLEVLAGIDTWRTQVLPAMDRLMWRREQVLRLAPTARSLLGAPA